MIMIQPSWTTVVKIKCTQEYFANFIQLFPFIILSNLEKYVICIFMKIMIS